MGSVKVLIRLKFNLWHDEYTGVFDCQILKSRYGRHSVASAWDTNEKKEVKLELFLIDFWSEKSLSIYSIDFSLVSKSLETLGFVDVWLEKL